MAKYRYRINFDANGVPIYCINLHEVEYYLWSTHGYWFNLCPLPEFIEALPEVLREGLTDSVMKGRRNAYWQLRSASDFYSGAPRDHVPGAPLDFSEGVISHSRQN